MVVRKKRPAFQRKPITGKISNKEANHSPEESSSSNIKESITIREPPKRKKRVKKPKLVAPKREVKVHPPRKEIVEAKPGRRRVPLNRAGHVLVDALAGTGKTFTILEGCKRLMGKPTPGVVGSPQQEAIWKELTKGDVPVSIAILAFNRSIKAEIAKELKSIPGANAYTCHGYGMQMLSKARVTTRNVDPRKTSFILADLYGCDDVFDFWRENRGYSPVVGKLVSLIKQNLIDYKMDEEKFRKELLTLAAYHCIDIPPAYDDRITMDVINVLSQSVKRTDVIDYDDMIWLPVALNLAPKKVDILFVDERQDLNKAQQEIVYRSGKRIVMVGDVNQAVYGFAGADAEACENMAKRLRANALGCKVFPLSFSRRCSKAVIREAQILVPAIQPLDDAPEGIVRSCDEADIKSGSEQFRPGDMVVCRTNAPLISYCLRMISDGIPARIQGKQIGEDLIGLIKQLKSKTCKSLIEATDNYRMKQTEKLSSQRNAEAALINLNDRCDSIICFAERHDTVAEIKEAIESIFDEKSDDECILLSSIHKAKGLEAYRVWFLYPEICPHPNAKRDWQIVQENNLRYVGETRAQHELIYVNGEPKK